MELPVHNFHEGKPLVPFVSFYTLKFECAYYTADNESGRRRNDHHGIPASIDFLSPAAYAANTNITIRVFLFIPIQFSTNIAKFEATPTWPQKPLEDFALFVEFVERSDDIFQ